MFHLLKVITNTVDDLVSSVGDLASVGRTKSKAYKAEVISEYQEIFDAEKDLEQEIFLAELRLNTSTASKIAKQRAKTKAKQ